MGVVFIVLIIVGFLLWAIGYIMEIAAAFRVSSGWGLAYIFVPGAQLIFTFKHWDDLKTAFFVQIGGFLLILGSLFYGVKYLESVDESLGSSGVDSGRQFVEALLSGDEDEEVESRGGVASTIGMSVQDAMLALGKPKATMISDRVTTLFYDGRELEVEDGVVVRDDLVKRMKLGLEVDE